MSARSNRSTPSGRALASRLLPLVPVEGVSTGDLINQTGAHPRLVKEALGILEDADAVERQQWTGRWFVRGDPHPR